MKINKKLLILSILLPILVYPMLSTISFLYFQARNIKKTYSPTNNSSEELINVKISDKINSYDNRPIYKNSSLIISSDNKSYTRQSANTIYTSDIEAKSINELVKTEEISNKDTIDRNDSCTIGLEPEYPDIDDGYTMEQDEPLQFKATPIPYWGYTFDIEIDGETVINDSHSQVPGFGIGDPPICFGNYCYYLIYHPELERGWHSIRITNVECGSSIEYNFLVVYRFIEYSYADPLNSFEKGKNIKIYNTVQNKYEPEARDISIKSEFSDNVEIVSAVIYRDGWVECEIQGNTVYADIGDLNGWPETDVQGGKDALYVTIKPLDGRKIINNVTVDSVRFNYYFGYYTNHTINHTYEYEVSE